jgi:hypothetical protein
MSSVCPAAFLAWYWAALISGKYDMSAPRRKEKSSGEEVMGVMLFFLQDAINKKIENRK